MYRIDVNTRLISFAGSTIAIAYCGDRATRIVNFLFQYLPPAFQTNLVESGNSPSLRQAQDRLHQRRGGEIFCLVSDDPAGLVLYENDTLVQHLQSEGEVAEYLLGQTCHHLADRGHGGLLLHAAGLNWQGQGVILPGQMRSGKSTLAAWLLTRGWQYLTDELVFIPHKTTDFQAFSRPLNLKWTARTILQQLFDVAGQANEILSSPGGDLIPPELLGSRNVFSASPLNLMIFPRYHRDGAFELRQLSKAQGGLELMKCLVNARNLPGHGFPEVVRIARAVPAYRMIYSNFAQVEQAIEGLFESKL